MKYKDPFFGEIYLKKLGETTINDIGESIVDTIYMDESGNYYIDTWVTTGGDKQPMLFLRKALIDKINEISKQSIL